LKRLLKVAPGIWSIPIVVVGTILSSVLLIYRGHLLKVIVDSAVIRDLRTFTSSSLLIILGQLVTSAVQLARTAIIGRYAERVVHGLRAEVFDHIGRVRLEELEKRHSGDILSRMTNDLDRIRLFLTQRLIDLIHIPLTALLAFGYLLSVDWVLTLVMSLAIPLLLYSGNVFSRPMARLGEEYQQCMSQSSGVAQDTLSGIEVVKAFNLEDQRRAKFRSAVQTAISKARLLERSRAMLEWFSATTAMIPFLILFGFGGYSVISGRSSAGAIMAFVDLFSYLTMPVSALPSLIGQVKVDMVSVTRVLEIMSYSPERTGGSTEPGSERSDIAVWTDRLSFSYQGRPGPTLSDVTISIRNGSKVAIVGPSGSGKSTLLKLLAGFYEGFEGEIGLLGRSIRDWDLSELRRHIALVPQEPYLFPDTVCQNISLGRPDADSLQVEEAAKVALAHDFISELPHGYNTRLSEAGSSLSGGQRQRLALARAVLRRAPIIMMDEPTSSLDAESEEMLWRGLDAWGTGKTRILVAHRLATVRNADWIVVLEGGRVVEQGTHADLVRAGGTYARLYAEQTETREVAGS